MSSYGTTKQDNQHRMVTGLFPDRASTKRAYNSISTRGYGKDDVNLMMSDTTRKTQFADPETELGSKAAEGAAAGVGIPEKRVKHYEEGINCGGILTGVTPRSEENVPHIQ